MFVFPKLPMPRIILFFSFFFCAGLAHSQEAWWVFFTDKNGTSFDPYSYFAPEAIARREQNNISLYDSSDFPVSDFYLGEIAKRVDTLGYPSRWFNAVGVVATKEQIESIRNLPFVKSVLPQQELFWQEASHHAIPDTIETDFEGEDRNLSKQIDPMKGKKFADHGHKGKGIIIAILDAGFTGADKHEAFDHLRFNSQIRSTYDFVKKDPNAYTGAEHGTMVLSCIAGITEGKQMGLAPEATFLLGRIAKEYGNQYRAEEYFLAAVEWADKQGAMIINCSGGPGLQSYFPEQMNGKIPLISRAANMAASKGILVIAAAGNEGGSYTPVLLPPSDADSVLCVTALNDSGFVADYSSRGPTPDFKHKPDLCAPGTAIVADARGDYEVSEGTSFSCPLLVGFAACLMEMYPSLSPFSVMDTMRRSATLYPYYDYAHGNGMPQADYFFSARDTVQENFSISWVNDGVEIAISENFQPDYFSGKLSLLYYSLEDEQGRIYKYEVIEVKQRKPLVIPLSDVRVGVRVHVFYEGYYASKQL